MVYPFMTLDDRTEIVHSEMKADGQFKVYTERPDAQYGFRHAACRLPDCRWEDIYQFSEAEMAHLDEVIRSTASLLLEFSRTGGADNLDPDPLPPHFLRDAAAHSPMILLQADFSVPGLCCRLPNFRKQDKITHSKTTEGDMPT